MTAAIRAVARGDLGCEAVVRRAGELGVLGWVRSDAPGELSLHAEGDPEGVEGLTAFVRERTDGVEVAPVKAEGHEQFAIRGVSAGAFVVHEHAGRFRLGLEVGGAMRSWAIPKAPSLDPAVKRFAVEADGPAEGDVWDRGAYEQGGRVPWPEALDRGHAVFVLHGERLRGGFALQRTRPPQWLLIKRRDAEARPGS